MSHPPLKAALIGCGRMGAHTAERLQKHMPKGWLPLNHAEAVASVPGLELVALCDKDKERLETAGERFGIEDRFEDYQALIEEMKPDILAIATRTHGRCEMIEFASVNGVKGLHVEKPISFNVADCQLALNAAKSCGTLLSYGTTRRYMEAYRQAKSIVESGEIGDIVQVTIEHGPGMLLWSHPHSVDLLLFFNDSKSIDYVQASCDIPQSAIKENCVDHDPIVEYAAVKFKNGVLGLIGSGAGMHTRISGTLGTVVVVADGRWIDISKKSEPDSSYFIDQRRIESKPTMSGTQTAFVELADAVRSNKALAIAPEEIELNQRILMAIALSSLNNGQKTNLTEVNEAFTVTGRFGDLYA